MPDETMWERLKQDFGVDRDDGHFKLTMAAAIKHLKKELENVAAEAAAANDATLMVKSAAVELDVAWAVELDGSFKVYVVDADAKATRTGTQKVTVTLEPLPGKPIDALVGPAAGSS